MSNMKCSHLNGLVDIDGEPVREGDSLVFPGQDEPRDIYRLEWEPEDYGFAIFYSNGNMHFTAFKVGMVNMMKKIQSP